MNWKYIHNWCRLDLASVDRTFELLLFGLGYSNTRWMDARIRCWKLVTWRLATIRMCEIAIVDSNHVSRLFSPRTILLFHPLPIVKWPLNGAPHSQTYTTQLQSDCEARLENLANRPTKIHRFTLLLWLAESSDKLTRNTSSGRPLSQ